MPTKLNRAGEQQNYVPAGNGDASGEYADNATGSNIHYFAKFARPLPSSFTTKKVTTKTKTQSSSNNQNGTNQAAKQPSKDQMIKDTLAEINKKVVNAPDDVYKTFTSKDLKGVLTTTTAKNYQIDKILDKIGFNKLPQVVDKDVFDAAVKESNFIAQRTMRAPNQAVADAYKDQLYNGTFYVNCSGGGAQYGQGMYCAADYTGKLSDGIKAEMKHYSGYGYNATVTFTLSKDAKIIKHQDLIKEFANRLSTDKDALEFAARTITQKVAGRYYDNLTDKEKARIKQDTEYFLTGDVKLQKSLKKDEAINILKGSKTCQDIENYLRSNKRTFENGRQPSGYSNYMSDYSVSSACQSLGLNDGSLAACMGYDAINAEGHGQSGSYTVILNRSKCIFLKD